MARASPTYKRIVPLLLTLCIVVTMLAFPVSADTLGGERIELLDYSTPDGMPSFTTVISPNKKTVDFMLPFAADISYIDIIFQTDNQTFTEVYSTDGLKNYRLDFYHLGDGLYRAFGQVDYKTENTTSILIDGLDGEYFITFNRVTLYSSLVENKPVTTMLIAQIGTNEPRYVTYTGDSITFPWTIPDQVWVENSTFVGALVLDYGWGAFDYIDIQLALTCASINSISVTYGGINLPFTVNTIDATAANGGAPTFMVSLTIDVTSLERTLYDGPMVMISGTSLQSGRGVNMVTLASVTGSVGVTTPNILGHFFSQVIGVMGDGLNGVISAVNTGARDLLNGITTMGSNMVNGFTSVVNSVVTWGQNMVSTVAEWGQNIVEAITGNGDSQGFLDDVENTKQEMENASDAMDELARPPADQVLPDLDEYLDTGSSSLFGEMMLQVTGDETVYTLTFIGVAVWLIGIVLGV